jgi:signal transduction histidine kinase
VNFASSIADMAGVVCYLTLLWIAFAEPLRELAGRARDLELEQRKDSVFVRFGRNVAGMVHNLRNLLTILYGLNSLLKQAANVEEARELAVRQRAAFDRMTKMIERILAVVKAKQDTSVRSVDLNELLSGIVDFFCTDLDFKHGVQVQLALCEQRPVVQAQPLELCEVMENLIRNSWESMAHRRDGVGNRIGIETFAGDAVGFAVSDNGPGIPGLDRCEDDDCRRRFQVGRTTKEKGTGLGIPFILEAARSNGWHVRIESPAGKGTCTTIVLRGAPGRPLAGGSLLPEGGRAFH